jgi:MoaA/NifB/PqqE/SkfB family radical SAM enzyme
MFETLIDIGWRLIWVSLDGPNEEINDYIRSRGFKKATDNLKRLAKLKKEKHAHFPTAGIYTTLTNMTYDKIVDFVELAHECGCDEGVNISGLIVEGEESGQFELSPEQKKALPEHIEAGIRRADELGVKTNFRTYLDEELLLDGMNMHRHYKHKKLPGISGAMCYEPWTSMSLLPDGRMGPCCAFYDENIDSIKERSLVDVWNGAYMTKVREGMVTGAPPDYCKRCPSNLFIVKERHRQSYTNVLLEHTQLESMSPTQRAARLAAKGINSLKKHGIRKAVVRGLEWRKIHSDV